MDLSESRPATGSLFKQPHEFISHGVEIAKQSLDEPVNDKSEVISIPASCITGIYNQLAAGKSAKTKDLDRDIDTIRYNLLN